MAILAVVGAGAIYPLAVRPPRGDGRIRRGYGGVHRKAGVRAAAARLGRKPSAAGGRAERRRHEQRVAARAQVGVQQRLYYRAHVGVGRVDFVHHKQAARQAGGAHVRVANLQRRHHRLVNRADGDLSRQIALGAPSRPRLFGALPPSAVVVQKRRALGVFFGADVAGDGEDDIRRRGAVREHALGETLGAPMNLDGGGARGEREIERIRQPRRVQARESPERGFRLAGACFGFNDGERLIDWNVARGGLYGVGFGVFEKRGETRLALEFSALFADVQADVQNRPSRPFAGDVHVAVDGGVSRLIIIGEIIFV